MKKVGIIILLVFVISCKTVLVNKQPQKIASSALELGIIGTTKSNMRINNFEINAIPQLNHKIRVMANEVTFNKSSYKAYKKARLFQGKENRVNYIDSLPNKPTFITFEIIDKVTLLNELNSNANAPVVNYLKTEPKAKIITTISVVFDLNTIKDIKQAEEVYISNVKYKKYDLELYKRGKLYKTIELTKGTIFTYKLSSFCWGENNKHQPILLIIIGEHSKCRNKTFKSYQDVERKKERIKFKLMD